MGGIMGGADGGGIMGGIIGGGRPEDMAGVGTPAAARAGSLAPQSSQ
jgi:hypothetical protein